MKPYIIYSALTALTLTAGGCSKADLYDPVPPDDLNDTSFDFNLSMKVSGKRENPKLESSDCGHHVTDMRIYVFRSDTGVGDDSFTYYRPSVGDAGPQDYFKVDDFNIIAAPEHITGDWTYTINPQLPKGYYRFLAVGRDEDARKEYGEDISIAWDKSTTWSNALISASDPQPSEEIFTGYPCGADNKPLAFHVDKVKAFSISIDLYRAVAGVLLYVENLPDQLVSDFSWNATRTVTTNDDDGNSVETEETYTVVASGETYPVSEIAVVTPGYSASMNLPKRHWTEESFIPETQEFNSAKLVSFDMAQIRAANQALKDEDGYYPVSQRVGSFVFPAQLKGRTIDLSYIPDDENAAEVTYSFPASMYLAFFTVGTDKKSYPVKMLPVIDERQTPHLPDGPSFYTPAELSVKKSQFNLVCNNIYCLGDFRENEDPTDKPIDLKKALSKPELNITVIGNWQADVDINL
ncbi:MAG: hypothetical protein HDR98_07735 [Bacteroides sp.]|nr:hypothetical protein [Bacteroides sp.]